MKILFIISKDVYNIPAAKVAEELIRRGHEIECFYALFMDVIHTRMFHRLGREIKPYSELTEADLLQYDCAYVADGIQNLPLMMNSDLYTFTFSTSLYTEPTIFADYVFSQRDFAKPLEGLISELEKYNAFCASPGMASGNPKFDIYEDNDLIGKNKQILYIDAGHFPYGKKAKMEEAKMLVAVARFLPEYKLVIKPRFLPNDKNVTHKNKVSLYWCIDECTQGNVPHNLEYLQEHVDLEKLVLESEVVITAECTSTYMEIGAYNKKGIIASGLPSEYANNINEGRMQELKKITYRSGLNVHYTEILDYLPDGLRMKKSHSTEMGLDRNSSAKTIVNRIEEIINKIVTNNEYPAIPFFGVQNKWRNVKRLRYVKVLYQPFVIMGNRVRGLCYADADSYIQGIYKDGTELTAETIDVHKSKITDIVSRLILENEKIMKTSLLGESFYLKALSDKHLIQYESRETYSVVEMYDWCMGKYFFREKKDYLNAVRCFESYLDIVNQHDFDISLADEQGYIRFAYYCLGVSYFHLSEKEKAVSCLEEVLKLAGGKYIDADQYIKRLLGEYVCKADEKNN